MNSTDALIRNLCSDLVPVQRRSMLREAGALLTLGAVELALVLMAGVMRPDMGRNLLLPFSAWKIGSLALLAVVSCMIAIRSFAPPSNPRRGLAATLCLAFATVVGGAIPSSFAESSRSLIERLAPTHGLLCMLAIVTLALPMMTALAVLMRRAAPLHPEQSAMAVGLAASTCGALLFAVCCPSNDPLYIVVWYSAGSAVIVAAARWLLPRRFRL